MGKSNSFVRLCDHCQFGNRGGWVAQIDLESVPLDIGLSDRHQRSVKLVDYLQSCDISGECFRARFMTPAVKSEWRRSGRVEVEHVPNLNIRQTQMDGNKLKQPVSRIEYQPTHVGFCYLSWQMLECLVFGSKPSSAEHRNRVLCYSAVSVAPVPIS
jgi:hypothetical protein